MTAPTVQSGTPATVGCPSWCVDHDHGGDGEHRTALVESSDRPGFGVSLRQPHGEPLELYVSWGEEFHQQADVGGNVYVGDGAGVTSIEIRRLGEALLAIAETTT
jgi:hypothetical protein